MIPFALQLYEVAYGCFIDTDDQFLFAVHGAVLLITKYDTKTQGPQDLLHVLGIFDFRFEFFPDFELTGFQVRSLEREEGLIPHLPQTERASLSKQRALGKIVEQIMLEMSGLEEGGAGALEFPPDEIEIVDFEFDFDFQHGNALSAAVQDKFRDQVQGIPVRRFGHFHEQGLSLSGIGFRTSRRVVQGSIGPDDIQDLELDIRMGILAVKELDQTLAPDAVVLVQGVDHR